MTDLTRRFARALVAAVILTIPSSVHAAEPSLVSDQDSSPLSTIGWVTASTGAALVVGGLVLAELGKQKDADTRDMIRNGEEPQRADLRTANSYATWGGVLAVSGAVAVATGVSFIIFAPSDDVGPRVEASVGPGSLSVFGSF